MVYVDSVTSFCKARNVDAKYIIDASTLIQNAGDFQVVGDAREVSKHSQVVLDDIFNDVSQIMNIPIVLALNENSCLIEHDTYLRYAVGSRGMVNKWQTELQRKLRTFRKNDAYEKVGFHEEGGLVSGGIRKLSMIWPALSNVGSGPR